MKNATKLICLLALTASFVHAEDISAERKKAGRDGAKAKLTFRVTDSLGNPVANADVRTGFFIMSGGGGEFLGRTDTNGMCAVEGICSGDALNQFTKDGYYPTSYRHWFSIIDGKPAEVKDGQWQPWNPTVEITLKEKRNPIPMYVKRGEIILPKTNETFGFDCQIGDLVAPHGTGKTTDMTFTYRFKTPSTEDKEQEYFAQFIAECTNKYEGMTLMKFDSWSNFSSAYEAPLEEYESQFEAFRRFTPKAEIAKKTLSQDEYLIFRSRVTTNEHGQITSAHYGKIYSLGCWGTSKKPDGGAVSIYYFFNTTPNDRNLESK